MRTGLCTLQLKNLTNEFILALGIYLVKLNNIKLYNMAVSATLQVMSSILYLMHECPNSIHY